MMGRGYGNPSPTGQRISIDQSVEQAKQSVSTYGKDLQVSEVMDFSENFYVVVKETSTGRGAFELLIDPYTGEVYAEMGPNMMWNSKYSPMGGMMGGFQSGDNTLSLDQAAQAAQKYLDANLPGAKLSLDGVSFFGHYKRLRHPHLPRPAAARRAASRLSQIGRPAPIVVSPFDRLSAYPNLWKRS